MKKVGILYDNISGNVGDQAIGISVREMLAEMGVDYEELVPGRFNPGDYRTIIIGGGYLLQPSPNFFYDKFRVPGKHILNCCGIVHSPDDLQYLNDYLYVTVRSKGDRQKLSCLSREVTVVPCTTMLLKDLPHFDLKIQKPSIGVQLWEGVVAEESFVEYLSNQPFHIYFLPITHYNRDFAYLARLSQKVKNSTLLPILRPEEIYTVIGNFDYFVCGSLHGAIFAYVHNVPFLLYNSQDKQRFFMKDRRLDKYLFKSFAALKAKFEELQNSKPDYSTALANDFKVLQEHKLKIKDIVLKQVITVDAEPVTTQQKLQTKNKLARLQERNFQIHYLQKQVEVLDAQAEELRNSLQARDARIANLETNIQERISQMQQIQRSIPMRLASRYQRVVERLLRPGTRLRRYYELGLTGIWVILNEGWRIFLKKVRIWFSSVMWQTGRAVYYRLPVSMSTKAKLVRFVMKYGGRFFQNVGSYRQWKQLQEREPTYKQPSPHPGFYDASKREPFNFPDAPSPAVSVIIPIHNKSNYTYACLYSIYENRPDVEFEVIVVDDCSTDDTQDLLKTIGGIQVIQNVTNLGFAGSVNCAAEVARGEYLLILNNDTLVHPGWMDELFAVMSSQPDIGLVGSQLIYPDGRLQESGCLMCQDGCAVPLGRFEDLLHPEFSYFREVDFCSAASILVRRKEFHKVGGLSTAYAPAYFEDVDFAFKLRGIGKRVFVQPLSKVTHYEAVSYSRELSADLIARNRRIFVEKWQRVLQQCSYTSPENFRTTPNYNHKRVLYIDAVVPIPDRGAGSVDAFWYMRFLIEAGYDVVFYGEHTPEFAPKYTPMIQRIGVQCLYQPYVDIERYLAEHGNSFSHVFVARVYQAMSFNSLIRRYCPNTRYIFNTVDVHFLREMRQAEVEKSPAMLEQAKQTRERELGIMKQADATIVVSTEEKELLEREYGIKRIYHIPLVREVYGCKHPFRERRDLVFIGSAHLPNVDATYYFHSEILPLIQRELPDVKFIVIGEYLRDALKERAEFDKLASDPSVELPGFVEDLSEYFEWIRVMVAPLRYGSGVKGKIVTGFQYGIPCVSTSIGTEGMGLTPEVDVLQAEDPVSFARAVVRLYTDQILWERLSENCMMFTREHFSEEIARRELLRIIA